MFRSALSYISQAGSQFLSTTQSDEQHDLIGQTIKIGEKQFIVRRLLAEGRTLRATKLILNL